MNGNRYDAITGELVNKVKKASAAIQRPASSRKMVDGFVLNSQKNSSNPKHETGAPQHPRVASGGLHTRHEKSKTLMRRVVKKPSTLKIVDTEQTHARSANVSSIRQSRAKTSTMHSAVSRFGFFPGSGRQTDQPVLAAPIKPTLKVKRVMQSEAPVPAVPSMITSVSHQKLEKMLDEALVNASAHKQMLNDSRRRPKFTKLIHLPRKLTMAIVFVAALAVTALLVWENLPSVAVHVAAARAHVNASMPGYTPSGFSFANPIEYESGSLTMRYIDKAHSSDGFSLTQTASNWNSASLAANSLPKDAPVQTSEVNGTTVFIYGHTNDATWVNHGVLYNLQNKSSLSSDQVMKIVGSL